MDTDNIVYRALRRLRFQRFLNWTGRLGGSRIRVPLLGEPLGSALMLSRETWKVDVFRRLGACLDLDLVLDVGANEGQTLVDLQKAGLGQVPVVAFEPTPACAFYLTRLIRANRWGHVALFPFALAERSGCVPLELESENSAGASIIPGLRPGREYSHRFSVAVLALDDLVASGSLRLAARSLIKIDVEGAELDVLKGAARTLKEHRPTVVCEVLWAHCDERLDFMRSRNGALMELLRACDYDVLRLRLARDLRSVLGLEPIAEFPSGVYGENNAHECDYLFVPREFSTSVQRHFGS